MRQYNKDGAWDCIKCGSGNIRLVQYIEAEITLRVSGDKVKDVLFVTCGTCEYTEVMKPVDATDNDTS